MHPPISRGQGTTRTVRVSMHIDRTYRIEWFLQRTSLTIPSSSWRDFSGNL
jgi:hypothetical protein